MTWQIMADREMPPGDRLKEEHEIVRVLRVSGMALHVVLKVAVFALQLVLTVLAACVYFGGGVLQRIGRIVGTLFVGSSIICLIMGLVSGREFWEMFLLGIAFGAVPAVLRMCGESGIYAIRSVLNKI